MKRIKNTMNKSVYLIFIIIVLGALYVFTPKGDTTAETLEDGIVLAKEQDKLVFLYINAVWCGYCRQIEREFAQSQEFNDIIGKNYIWVTLDFDENLTLARQYGLKGPPAMIVLDQDGQPITGIPGYPPGGVLDVIAMLKEALK